MLAPTCRSAGFGLGRAACGLGSPAAVPGGAPAQAWWAESRDLRLLRGPRREGGRMLRRRASPGRSHSRAARRSAYLVSGLAWAVTTPVKYLGLREKSRSRIRTSGNVARCIWSRSRLVDRGELAFTAFSTCGTDFPADRLGWLVGRTLSSASSTPTAQAERLLNASKRYWANGGCPLRCLTVDLNDLSQTRRTGAVLSVVLDARPSPGRLSERMRRTSGRYRVVRRRGAPSRVGPRLRNGVFRLGSRVGLDTQAVVRFSEAVTGRRWRRCGIAEMDGL